MEVDVFKCPDEKIWLEREALIDNEIARLETGCYLVSDHSTALFMDMRRAYCGGAWLSVVVMSISVIDSHLRETESGDNKIGTAKLLNEFVEGEDVNWLRQLRNRIVHLNLVNPEFTMNAWFDNQKELEEQATKAMLTCIRIFFQTPGV